MIVLSLMVALSVATADSAHVIERGTFRLHKFAQPIGEERYTIARDSAGGLAIESDFLFTDRTQRVPLSTTLLTAGDLSPRHFASNGKTSRESTIDLVVDIDGARATIRDDTVTTTRPVAPGTPIFTMSGYAPIVMQQEMIRYWMAHGMPDVLTTLPEGAVGIQRRGLDTVTTPAGSAVLTRYSIGGLIWGRETVWLDDSARAVAVVTEDAEFDHFEAVRDGYEPLLGRFIARAATDALDALTSLTAQESADAGSFVVVGADLIDGTGAALVHDAVVVVRDGRIVAAGPKARTPVPRGVTVIDAAGKTIMPGLWDMHAHYEQVEWGPIYLASGVTTARDVGNEFDFIKSVRDALRAGRGIGPRLLLAGVIDGSGPAALGVIRADTPDEGRARVRQYHDAGFDQIKIYSSIKLDVLRAICAEAHALGMTVTGHIPEGLTAYQGVDAGMDQINHAVYLAPLAGPPVPPGATVIPPAVDSADSATHALSAFLLAHHTVLDPTLAIFEWVWHPASTPVSTFEPGVTKVAPELLASLTHVGSPPARAARDSARFARLVETIRVLHHAGVPIVAGTDQTIPGYSLHREMELYVEAGFTPMEAIEAATSVPARVMHLDREVGTVVAGRRADLLIVDGHPLDRIADTRNVWLVVANGRRYTPAPLWRSVEFTP
jgi:hypothetical protein